MIEGEFFDDKVEGYAVKTWSNGSRYEGDWRNGKEDGKGSFTSTTTTETYKPCAGCEPPNYPGQNYSGMFSNGKPNPN